MWDTGTQPFVQGVALIPSHRTQGSHRDFPALLAALALETPLEAAASLMRL